MDEWLRDALSLILTAALSAGGGGLLMARAQRRKTDAESGQAEADAAQVLTGVAMQLLDPLRAQLAATQTQLEDTRAALAETRTQADALSHELTSLREEYELYRRLNPPTR